MKLVLPLPPSVNQFWRTYRGRMLISEAGRKWKKQAELAALAHRPQKIDGDVAVSMVVYFENRRRDVDNVIKPTLDVLAGLCFTNDRQVSKLAIEKRYDADNPRIEIELEAA